MDVATLFFAFLWWLSGSGSRSTSSPAPAPALPSGTVTLPPQVLTSTSSPPWPQVVPPGLPSFPGGGWEFDEPPPLAVQQRAGQLVSPLWKGGAGTFKIEQTGGRWIAYRAEKVRSGKQGVVAYRQRKAAAPSKPPPGQATASRAPAPAPRAPAPPGAAPAATRSPGVPQRPQPVSVPAGATPAATAAPSILNLPTLRYGMGLAPQPPVPEVVLLQQRLGFPPPECDGRFGGDTRTAVLKFQVKTGLAPNLPHAELLRRQFGVVKQATWTKLFDVRA